MMQLGLPDNISDCSTKTPTAKKPKLMHDVEKGLEVTPPPVLGPQSEARLGLQRAFEFWVVFPNLISRCPSSRSRTKPNTRRLPRMLQNMSPLLPQINGSILSSAIGWMVCLRKHFRLQTKSTRGNILTLPWFKEQFLGFNEATFSICVSPQQVPQFNM